MLQGYRSRLASASRLCSIRQQGYIYAGRTKSTSPFHCQTMNRRKLSRFLETERNVTLDRRSSLVNLRSQQMNSQCQQLISILNYVTRNLVTLKGKNVKPKKISTAKASLQKGGSPKVSSRKGGPTNKSKPQAARVKKETCPKKAIKRSGIDLPQDAFGKHGHGFVSDPEWTSVQWKDKCCENTSDDMEILKIFAMLAIVILGPLWMGHSSFAHCDRTVVKKINPKKITPIKASSQKGGSQKLKAAPPKTNPQTVKSIKAAPPKTSPQTIKSIEAAPPKTSPQTVKSIKAEPPKTSPQTVKSIKAETPMTSPQTAGMIKQEPCLKNVKCIDVYTDASGKHGFGCVWDQEWTTGRWNDTCHKDHGNNMEFLETYAILAALATWGPEWMGCTVTIHSDNHMVVKKFNEEASMKVEPHIKMLFRDIGALTEKYNFDLKVVLVSDKKFALFQGADGLSKGSRDKFLKNVPDANTTATLPPKHLRMIDELTSTNI